MPVAAPTGAMLALFSRRDDQQTAAINHPGLGVARPVNLPGYYRRWQPVWRPAIQGSLSPICRPVADSAQLSGWLSWQSLPTGFAEMRGQLISEDGLQAVPLPCCHDQAPDDLALNWVRNRDGGCSTDA